MTNPTLVLASSSPRRRQLLSLTRWEFSIVPGDVDETVLPGEDPRDYVLRLALAKARAVDRRLAAEERNGSVVLASDTTVSVDGKILGKPDGSAEAIRMLRDLRNREHQVYTAIAALDQRSGRLESDLCVTNVHMRDYSDAELAAYVATGDPLDKAGAYAIQHSAFHPVDGLTGCYTGVMGLPVCHVVRLLAPFGFVLQHDLVAACCAANAHECPEMEGIMARREPPRERRKLPAIRK